MQAEYKELSEKAINVDCVMNVAILIKPRFENCGTKEAYPSH
jgi:hypothetical protein